MDLDCLAAARRGVLLHVAGVLDRGDALRTSLKCWAAQGSLRWELRRLLPASGWKETRHRHLSKALKDMWTEWEALAWSMGLYPHEHLGKSRRAIAGEARQQGRGEVEGEHEFWVSTTMLLLLFVHLRGQKRRPQGRVLARELGRLFVELCVPASSLQGFDEWVPPQDVARLCSKDPKVDGFCACLQRASSEGSRLVRGEQSPQNHQMNVLRYLFELRECRALREWASLLVKRLSAVVDMSVRDWGDFHWHQTPAAACKGLMRGRRVDQHAKMLVLESAVQDGKTATLGQAAKAMYSVRSGQAVKWCALEMAAYRATCLLTFSRSQTLAIAFDAARIGKPAKELIVGILSDPLANKHCVLPPQVPLLQSLIAHVLGDEYGEGKIKAAILARSRPGASAGLVGESGLFTASLMEAVDDVVDEDQDVHMHWERMQEQKRAQQRVEALRMQQLDLLRPVVVNPDEDAVDTRVATPPKRPRAFIAQQADGYSQEQAREWLPPGARMTKDDRRENRWRVRAPCLSLLGGAGAERSKSYGKGERLSDYGAMVFCLQMVWRAHIQAHGGECPFDWEG